MIHAHNHLGVEFGGGWTNKSVNELTDRLNEAYVDTYIDLDGGWGEDILDARLRRFKEAVTLPRTFHIFPAGRAGSIGKLRAHVGCHAGNL